MTALGKMVSRSMAAVAKAGPIGYPPATWVRAAFLIVALVSAAMAAMMTGSVAHDEFAISLDTIRADALSAAGIIFTVVSLGSLLTRKK